MLLHGCLIQRPLLLWTWTWYDCIVKNPLKFGSLKYPHLDYKLALKEYSLVGGQIPLPPRYAFGVFYSRYRAYNDIGEMVKSL